LKKAIISPLDHLGISGKCLHLYEKYTQVCVYTIVIAQCRKANRTVKHIWFLPIHKANAEKPKELALTHRTQTE
jgi:hypothetical protein